MQQTVVCGWNGKKKINKLSGKIERSTGFLSSPSEKFVLGMQISRDQSIRYHNNRSYCDSVKYLLS